MAKKLNGIHHIAMDVSNFEKSVKFYTEVIGCVPTYSWGEGVDSAIMLDAGNDCKLELFANGKGKHQEGAWRHLAFNVADCDATYEAAIAAGAVSQSEPKDVDIPSKPEVLKVRIAFVKGYDDEVVELFQLRG